MISNRGRDPYKILGVDSSASEVEIKKAYVNLVKKYHPDLSITTAEEHQLFEDINEAYSCLKDPVKKNEYDRNASSSSTGSQQFEDQRQAKNQDFQHSKDNFAQYSSSKSQSGGQDKEAFVYKRYIKSRTKRGNSEQVSQELNYWLYKNYLLYSCIAASVVAMVVYARLRRSSQQEEISNREDGVTLRVDEKKQREYNERMKEDYLRRKNSVRSLLTDEERH